MLMAALLGAGCAERPPAGWSGYVEGEYVLVSSPLAGTLAQLPVQAGGKVAQGAPLFVLDDEAEALARAEAQARLGVAEAQARNTETGRRADEVAVARAQLARAKAQAALARTELARVKQLVAQNFVSAAQLDDAQAALSQADAQVTELEAALRVAQLPARVQERAAAQAGASAAQQQLKQADWRLQQKAQRAPAAAEVADTFFRVGEWVPAGQPIVSLLPAGAVKARFYVAETEAGALAPGQAVLIRCDGCGAPINARISRIATQAEYTPPVIYSNAQRAKLVFMVEARPAPADAPRLRPGQPIDVQRAS
ncbi:HlyD family efflux transporter periplasmic adaptor subunit [Aquincola sp. S2]|uniref:HlyD family efflux transporter periplasmic adaptor subunit n=2 Tax=Pseudaquabacterium terrae TaxID=2732868 RepID=A0ABX2EKR4_9BURK|nr:HlyD family efflux transporter periplasmic adaptor subunit [Aquabacterium terrae]NRF69161.1 HlyD family efflux transporter periplasmic adaptor subunit [Aquabacterium terrae]